MSAHPPPVPPEQRPDYGRDAGQADIADHSQPGSANGNVREQGRAGNIKQNTTNKGLQQDR